MKLADMFNAFWPPRGIAFTAMAVGYHLKSGNGWCVAIHTILLLISIAVTMTRILEKGNKDE